MVDLHTMPVTAQTKKIEEEGQEKDALVVSITNGAKQQIEELQAFFKTPDTLEVVKLGISVLQKIKEQQEREKQNGTSKE